MNRKYRKTVIAGNWKMNMLASEIKPFMEQLKENLPKTRACDVVLCTPAPLLPAMIKAGKDCKVAAGGQDVSKYEKGAYTGEVSAAQLAEELRARGEVKGEIALVIAPPSEDEETGIVPVGAAAADPDEALREDIRAALEEGEPASAVAKRLSQKYSRRKRDVYAMVLDMQ